MNPCEEEPSSRTKKLKFCPRSGLSLLPEEMVLSCMALLLTPELYNLRTLSGCTDNLIYLCLSIPPEPNPRWFTLSPKTLDRRLVPVRSYFYQPLEASCMVAHGWRKSLVECHIPGLSIPHVEHSPLHGGASVFSCGWCGAMTLSPANGERFLSQRSRLGMPSPCPRLIVVVP